MTKHTPIFKGSIVDGELKLAGHVRESIKRWLRTFKTGADVDIRITKHRKQSTDTQRAYYFATVVPILGDYFGYTKEEMHEELKLKFNPKPSKLDPTKVIGGSTKDLSTEEFYSSNDPECYVERICRWAATEYGIFVPPPSTE
jgi:hypothetical protein